MVGELYQTRHMEATHGVGLAANLAQPSAVVSIWNPNPLLQWLVSS